TRTAPPSGGRTAKARRTNRQRAARTATACHGRANRHGALERTAAPPGRPRRRRKWSPRRRGAKGWWSPNARAFVLRRRQGVAALTTKCPGRNRQAASVRRTAQGAVGIVAERRGARGWWSPNTAHLRSAAATYGCVLAIARAPQRARLHSDVGHRSPQSRLDS